MSLLKLGPNVLDCKHYCKLVSTEVADCDTSKVSSVVSGALYRRVGHILRIERPFMGDSMPVKSSPLASA